MVSSILGPLLNIFISGKMYDLEMTYPAQSVFRPRESNPDTYGDAVAGWARGGPPTHQLSSLRSHQLSFEAFSVSCHLILLGPRIQDQRCENISFGEDSVFAGL